ncbi:RodZ domain-containing protein [Enterococcus olivae]
MGNEIIIGDRLRQARLNKNISIDELQKITKIQKRYLEAIEAGEFDRLPGEYYVRSFLREYAAVVGENGDFLVAVFDEEATFGEDLPKRPQPETVEGSRKAMHVEEARKKRLIDYVPMMLLGLIALTIIGIVGYMTWQDRQAAPIIGNTTPASIIINESSTSSSEEVSTETSSSTEETSTTESEEETEMAIERITSTQRVAEYTVSDAENPVVITLKGKNDRCWVGITADGSGYLFQQTLEATDEETITLPEGATNVELSLGMSANIEIEINGETLEFDDPQFELLQKNLRLTISYQE